MKNSIIKYVKKCPLHPKPLNELQGQMENKRVFKQVIYYDYILSHAGISSSPFSH